MISENSLGLEFFGGCSQELLGFSVTVSQHKHFIFFLLLVSSQKRQ